MKFLYLHGFASSPASRKAVFFQSQLREHGISLEIPALDQGDFEHLTISGQLKVAESYLDGGPAVLIGSSMGGYLASLLAARHAAVQRLVLLAPAFGFAPRWREMTGEARFTAWQDTGWLEVFNYASKSMSRVHYGLYEDALQYAGYPDFSQPAMIFHGLNDTVVPVDLSRTFAASHANAQLVEMDSDHELTDVLDAIGAQAVPFLLGNA